MINQIEHNEVKSSQISENEVVGSKDSSGTIIHIAEQVKLINIHGISMESMVKLMELEWND